MRNDRSFTHPAYALAVVLLSTICFLPSVFGQASTATLSGTVEDQNGAVLPAASVTVVNVSTGFQRTAVTNESGLFTVPLLPPASYSIRVTHDGFSPVEVRDVVLNVGDQKALQIQLKAGDVNAAVTIDSNAEMVRTDGSVGTVVNQQFVANIPLNGRSFNTLLELTPGIVLTTSRPEGQFSSSGQRNNANYFTVDGVGANIGVTSGTDPELSATGGGALPPVSALGGSNTLVSVDAVQEFKVLTSSFAPEFGRSPGAQVSVVTRSGTNDFHGTVFDYLRNDVLDANDWFANSRGLKRAAERQNDFGGTFSGPILLPRFGEGGSQPGYSGRAKIFFFFSYEGLRLRVPQTRVVTVPSLAARQAATNPAIRALLNAHPLPNGQDFGNNTAEFAASFSNQATINATSLRIDDIVNKRVQVFARYNDSPSHAFKQSSALSTNSTSLLNTRTFTAGAIFTLRPNVVNDLRLNWSRVRGATIFGSDSFGGAVPLSDSLVFPSYASRENAFASFSLGSGISTYSVGNVADNKQRQFNLVDSLSVVKWTHQLKFGIDYRQLNPTNGYRHNDFFYSFSSVSQALTGVLTQVQVSTIDIDKLEPRFLNLSLYGQDTWKVTSRLSLTYGMRWEYDPPPSEATRGFFGLTSIVNLATVALTPAGTPLWKSTSDNFAPRFGFAYQVSQRPGRELLVRGGAGMFYDLGNPVLALSGFPYGRSSITSNVPFPGGLAQLAPIPFSLNPPYGSVRGMSDPNLKLPLIYQWNVAAERSLGRLQSISASYVGAAGRRLFITRTFTNPNPNFARLSVITNGGTSDYHALQLQFQRRLSSGLQALASYGWSHSIDIGSSYFFALNGVTLGNLDQERGNSDFDIRHSFSAAVTYNIPKAGIGNRLKPLFKGWWLDSMFRARGAAPVDVSSFRNIPGVGFISLRPDVVAGVPLYISNSTLPGGRRFNNAAFVVPTTPRQGTLARNTLRGIPVWQLDIALRRQVDLTENLNMQLRVEAFNVFNHPNFGNPVTDLNSAQFGVPTSMFNQSLGGTNEGGFNPLYQIGGPRSLQFGLKLVF